MFAKRCGLGGGLGPIAVGSLAAGTDKGETGWRLPPGLNGLLASLGASWGSAGPSRVPLGTLWVTLGTLVGPLWGLLGGLGEVLGAVDGLKRRNAKKGCNTMTHKQGYWHPVGGP